MGVYNKIMNKLATHKRVNITLSPETIRLVQKVAKQGERSRLVDEAIRFYVGKMGRAKVRRQIREGALHRAERDLKITQDWSCLHDIWARGKK